MDYKQFKIKTYDNWDLFLHTNQYPYIGRCYAWAHREEAKSAIDMNAGERTELFDIVIKEWDSAIRQLFNHDLPNVASFGNTVHHLHWHLIPRYNSPKEFYGIKFEDPNPEGNYSTYPKKKIEKKNLLQIKEDIKSNLI